MKRFFAFIFMLAVGWGYLAAGDPVDMSIGGDDILAWTHVGFV